MADMEFQGTEVMNKYPKGSPERTLIKSIRFGVAYGTPDSTIHVPKELEYVLTKEFLNLDGKAYEEKAEGIEVDDYGHKVYSSIDIQQAFLAGLKAGSQLDKVWHDYDAGKDCYEDTHEGRWIKREAGKPKWHEAKSDTNSQLIKQLADKSEEIVKLKERLLKVEAAFKYKSEAEWRTTERYNKLLTDYANAEKCSKEYFARYRALIDRCIKAEEIIKTFLGFAEAFGYSPSMDKFISETKQFLEEGGRESKEINEVEQ